MPDTVSDVRPFRALRYDPKNVADIGLCLSQPYDVISPAQQDAYYAQHPYNAIRLILNKIEASDTESNNRYTRSRDLLRQWSEKGILLPGVRAGVRPFRHRRKNREGAHRRRAAA